MKKLLVLFLVLSLVSFSSAAVASVSLQTDKAAYLPGEIAIISLVSDQDVNAVFTNLVTATPNMGVAAAATLWGGYNLAVNDGSAYLVNAGGVLFERTDGEAISGQHFALIPGGSDCPAGEAIFSFPYALDVDALLGEITVSLAGSVVLPDASKIDELGGTVVNVVPEPMTMTLLGLGGLGLLRRRRA